MDLYFLLCGAFSILVAFGIFEKVLKINSLNRYFLSLFLIISCILSAVGSIKIYNINISLNLFLYLLVFIIVFLKQKKVKNVISTILTSLIVIAVVVCYNALNFSSFEYAYVQPYVYIALFLGFILNFVCSNFKSCFCGVFLGTVLSEFIFYEMSIAMSEEIMNLGSSFTITFTFISTISFCFINAIFYAVKCIKSKKQEKIET